MTKRQEEQETIQATGPVILALQSYDPRQGVPTTVDHAHDHHVFAHQSFLYELSRPSRELKEVIELAWCHRTGKLKTPSAGKADLSCGEGGHCDRAKLAAEYIESTPGFGELLWPVIVAVGDGCLHRKAWGNRTPSWSVAHRLWSTFAPRLLRRLAVKSFALYVADREKDMAYDGKVDDLREEAMRLAEIDRKYAFR